MRRLIRATMAAAAGLVLAAPTAVPAAAEPAPNGAEWWFDSYAIQSKVWPLTKGAGVTVAVIDTGVSAGLPVFSGGTILPGTDVEGNGGDGRQDTDSGSGHGTVMASLIAGQSGGPGGWLGIAPEAKILSIVANISAERSSRAIRYAADHGAKVISISQGSTVLGAPNNCPPQVLDAVAYAVKHDVVVLAAAGNEGNTTNSVEYPGSCPGVLAVGAIDHLGNAWDRTERQNYVAISAPGAGVGGVGKDGRVYNDGDGTSQATALASAGVALIRSKFPDESAKQVVQRIIATVTDVGSPGKDDQTGYGALSLRKALTADVPSTAPNPVYDRLDKALASQPKNPGAASTPAAAGKKSSSSAMPFLLVAGVVVIIALLVVIFVIRRSRRRPPPSAASAPFSSGYGQSPHQGPPPSFGPPQHQDPGGGSRPAFQPPPNQGPPPG